MKLTCYLHPGWAPLIRPAPASRQWMTETPESFAYRCLPLNMANAHGWEILSPCAFDALWTGGTGSDAVQFRFPAGTDPDTAPVSLFGQGVLTFHIQGLFRTEPGWSLWIGGSPNQPKDAIQPLTGVVETDWSPYTFTMNWRFTRPNTWVPFAREEPICFFFPVQRDNLANVQPRFEPLEDAPELMAEFKAWSESRNAFQARVTANPPAAPADHWQKLYYRGVRPSGNAGPSDHLTKLRVQPFAPVGESWPQRASHDVGPEQPAAATLAKRDWLLDTQRRLRALAPRTEGVMRVVGISPTQFLEEFYAANRPVILGGAAQDWLARSWSPEYLKQKVGSAIVEVQARRTETADFERFKEAHRIDMPFDVFIDRVTEEGGNDLYLTAFNACSNRPALSPLNEDLGTVPGLLDETDVGRRGMLWLGGAGTFTPLHHDLTNNLLVQITGRKQVTLIAPTETPRLYNDLHVFSRVADILAPDLDLKRFPLLDGVRYQALELAPGDALFIPIGWWHQVRSLDFSASVTYTNFVWPNDYAAGFQS
jgi:hypothetical protein